MDRNTKVLLGSLLLTAVLWLLVWAIVTGGFDRPPGSGGWLYEYQTLIGVAGALVAAAFTVFMMHREQQQQRQHFMKQMDVLTRADRLRVSRETARVIPVLEKALLKLQDMTNQVANAPDGQTMYKITYDALFQATFVTRDTQFTDIFPFLDDEFTRRRAALFSKLMNTTNTLSDAFGAKPHDPTIIMYGITVDRARTILQGNNWLCFDDCERGLQWLIEYLQAMRIEYGLTEITL